LTGALVALSLQASRYLSGVSGCSIHASALPVERGDTGREWQRLQSCMGCKYNARSVLACDCKKAKGLVSMMSRIGLTTRSRTRPKGTRIRTRTN